MAAPIVTPDPTQATWTGPGQGGDAWTCPAGMSQSYAITINDGSGNPITSTYAGTEALNAVAWEGSNLAPIAGMVALSWDVGADGTVTATYSPASNQAPGYYRLRCDVTYSGQQSPFYAGWLKVEPVAASGTEAATYCSFNDMEDLAGDWLRKLMMTDPQSQTNFVAERAQAREWLDDIIVGRSRVFAYRFDLTYALYYGSFPFGPVESPDRVIANYLASNYLMIKPRTIECTAYKALAFVCEKRMTFDADGEDYRKRAIYYHQRASSSLRRYRPELDTNADGIPDIAFNLGVLTFR